MVFCGQATCSIQVQHMCAYEASKYERHVASKYECVCAYGDAHLCRHRSYMSRFSSSPSTNVKTEGILIE